MIQICQFGAGRIGKIHAGNLARHEAFELRYVVDVHEPSARALADQYGARVTDTATALADPELEAVLIASSTDTHADLIEAAAGARKAIFCEKPIDLDRGRVDACLAVVAEAGVPCMIGFNRRFDHSFRALKEGIDAGRVGAVEIVTIISRDPGPPPVDYIRVSGGLFRDMTIHDFDMGRWLLGEEPVQVFATASCLVDPVIGQAGDVDTAVVVMRTALGKLCQISNSRRATYGYDQRIEVHGSTGMLRAHNMLESLVEHAGEDGVTGAKPLHFFLERYADAYRRELDHFAECLRSGKAPSPGPEDGRRSLALADAATESLATGRPVAPKL
ncbi:MAG TPA: inositol 2-dehydrogenase [Geminicoccaceae bacterium]|nr:inositol 2-dehydrogenase [Geminicoccaceae bacterium]